MATATAAPEELTATIDQRIIAATAKVRNIEQRIAEAAEELAGLRTEYSGACTRLAGGANGAGDDVERYRAKMLKVEAKISGLRQLLAIPKGELDRFTRELSLIHISTKKPSRKICSAHSLTATLRAWALIRSRNRKKQRS